MEGTACEGQSYQFLVVFALIVVTCVQGCEVILGRVLEFLFMRRQLYKGRRRYIY